MTNSPLIESKDQLINYIAAGSKPNRDTWRIGSEHEKFVFYQDNGQPLSYEGVDGRPGIKHLLNAFVARGWERVEESGNIIAAKRDGASITLEPGGQFELSGAPLETIHQTCDETSEHLRDVRAIGKDLEIGFLGMGFHPFLKREDIPVMPKARYDIMRAYMPKVGSLGLDMMLRSCTVQVNLDYADERDMVEKFRVSLALQPIATALFAASPFKEGADTGFHTYRSHIWTDTDPDRCGMLPFVFDDDFGFERYVDYVLDVPMYFVKRDGKMLDASGLSFRDFMVGKLEILPGELPTMTDFEDHLTTIFPEVRLKTFLEMRGADAGAQPSLCALPALWVGLLYNEESQGEVAAMVKDWTVEDMEQLRADTPKLGLAAEIKGRSVREIAGDMLRFSDYGLARRRKLNSMGETEQGFLSSLHDVVTSGKTPADRYREKLADLQGDMLAFIKDQQF